MTDFRQQGGDAHEQPSLFPLERLAANQRQRAPCASPTSDRSNHHTGLNRRPLVTDELRQRREIPARVPRSGKEQVRLLAAALEARDAPVRRLKERGCVAKRVAKRPVRVAHIPQLSSQAVEEFERRQFTLLGQHHLKIGGIRMARALVAVKPPMV